MKLPRWSSRCVLNVTPYSYIHQFCSISGGNGEAVFRISQKKKKRKTKIKFQLSMFLYHPIFLGIVRLTDFSFWVGPPKNTRIGSDVGLDGRQSDWLPAPLRQIPAAPNSQPVTLRVHRPGERESKSKQASCAKWLAIRVLGETTEKSLADS